MSKKNRKSAAAQSRATATYQRSARANTKVRGEKDSPHAVQLRQRKSYAIPSEVMRVRIAAIVISAATLIAAVDWAIRLQADTSTTAIAGIILLAFLSGLAAVTAFRTEAVMKRLSEARKRQTHKAN